MTAFTRPRPDAFPLDFGVLSSGYSGLLGGLGGFAITVLAVILRLDALESKANPRMHSAYGAVLRQVSQSLTVASITCFIGALMQGEVTAQTSAAQRAREEANTELQRHRKALGVGEREMSSLLLEVEAGERLLR